MARTILKIHKTKATTPKRFPKESWFTIKGTNLLKGFTFISDGNIVYDKKESGKNMRRRKKKVI